MTRAELRRLNKAENAKAKTYNMTSAQLEGLRKQEYERAKKEILSRVDELSSEILKMMIVIPTNVLINDYWEKTAERRIPRFVEDCLELYDSWQKGSVSMEDMQSLTERYAKIKLVNPHTSTGRVLERRKEVY